MKIVINNCFGGFDLSTEAMTAYYARKGRPVVEVQKDSNICFDAPIPDHLRHDDFMDYKDPRREEWNEFYNNHALGSRDPERNDPDLVAVVEELGEKADGRYARLKVVEIPDGVDWFIHEYDGSEHIAETHRTWG
jgi:hypothetical protein